MKVNKDNIIIHRVGRNIAQARAWRSMSLDDLALAAGIPPSLMDDYEQGRKDVGLHALQRIADALGVDIRALADVG